MMLVCVDTNVMLNAVARNSALAPIFDAIPADADDNKFADCAIATHADFVFTHDLHFSPLANAGYRPQPISPEEFIRTHLSGP